MLCLGRRVGERILIGDNIVIELLRIGPNSCRLGITAPADVVIVREELKLQLGNSLPDPTDELVKACRALSESKPATAPVGDKRENG